jgi:hypothetical protein
MRFCSDYNYCQLQRLGWEGAVAEAVGRVDSISRVCRHRRLPITVEGTRHVSTQREDSKRYKDEGGPHPEAQVTVYMLPMRARFVAVATISFPDVPASRHPLSISEEYSPRRAAWLQLAR